MQKYIGAYLKTRHTFEFVHDIRLWIELFLRDTAHTDMVWQPFDAFPTPFPRPQDAVHLLTAPGVHTCHLAGHPSKY